MKELKDWVPKKLHFSKIAGTVPSPQSYKRAFCALMPMLREELRVVSAWLPRPVGAAQRPISFEVQLTLPDWSQTRRMGPREMLRRGALGNQLCLLYHREHIWGCYCYLKLQEWAGFLGKFSGIIFMPGSLAVSTWTSSCTMNSLIIRHYFGTETLLLGRLSEHTAVGLYCYLQRCTFFVKVKNYTNVRNLCISISELGGSDGFKYM